LPILLEAFEVQLDCFVNVGKDFFPRLANSDASREL
jgi:hypothetical protein